MKRFPALVSVIMVLSSVSYAISYTVVTDGIYIYNVEDWSQPIDAWICEDVSPAADKWILTKEHGSVWREANYQTYSLRAPDALGAAPPLHTRITGVPNGLYSAYIDDPTQGISLSFDGIQWQPFYSGHPGVEIPLGPVTVKDNMLELWADDNLERTLGNGRAYYDYIRLEAIDTVSVKDFSVHAQRDGSTQITWVTDAIVLRSEVRVTDSCGHVISLLEEPFQKVVHEVFTDRLEPRASYVFQVVSYGMWGEQWLSEPYPITISRPAATKRSHGHLIPLSVCRPDGSLKSASGETWTVRSGIPFEKGRLAEPRDVAIIKGKFVTRGKNTILPAQYDVLGRWDDGSVKWLLVIFQAPMNDPPDMEYHLQVWDSLDKLRPLPDNPVSISENNDAITIENGLLRAYIDKHNPALPGSVWIDLNRDGDINEQEQVSDASTTQGMTTVDADGVTYRMGPAYSIEIEDPGPVWATVLIRGPFLDENGAHFLDYACRVSAFANSTALKLELAAVELDYQRYWTEIGQWNLDLPMAGVRTAALQNDPLEPVQESCAFQLLQDTDNHYLLKSPNTSRDGEKAIGMACIETDKARLTACVRDFWQLYPKGLHASSEGIRVGLFPALPENQYKDILQRDHTVAIEPIKEYAAHIASLNLQPASPGHWDTLISTLLAFRQAVEGTDLAMRADVMKVLHLCGPYIRVEPDAWPSEAMARDEEKRYWEFFRKWADPLAGEAMRTVSHYFWCKDGKYVIRHGTMPSVDVYLRWDDPSSESPSRMEYASFVQDPPLAVTSPAHYCATGVWGQILPRQEGMFPEYERMADIGNEIIRNGKTMFREYGWANYGDFSHGFRWGNGEYDYSYGASLHFARTGDLDALWRAYNMVKHNCDIDTLHIADGQHHGELGQIHYHNAGHAGVYFGRGDWRLPDAFPDTDPYAAYVDVWFIGGFDPLGHNCQAGKLATGMLFGDRRFLKVAEDVVHRNMAHLAPCWNDFYLTVTRGASWPLYNAMAAYNTTGDPYYLAAAHYLVDVLMSLEDPYRGGFHGRWGASVRFTGFIASVLCDYYEATHDQEAYDMILRCVDWIIKDGFNHDGGYFYEVIGGPYLDPGSDPYGVAFMSARAFSWAYEQTRNDVYLKYLTIMMDSARAWHCGSGKGYGKQYGDFYCAFKTYRGLGLDDVPKPETTRLPGSAAPLAAFSAD